MSDVHRGHRERLRRRAQREGLASFQPHEILELLLMQAIPQRDVNPLAHELIAAFGGVDAVLSAPEEALRGVPGVGERTARWLRAVGRLTEVYARLERAPAVELQTFSQVASLLERMNLGGREAHLLLCMDSAGRLAHNAALAAEPGAFPPLREAVAAALRFRAASVCSVHVAPGAYRPEEETRYARSLAEALALIDIGHMDHIVLRDGRAVSLRRPEEALPAQEEELAAERPYAAQRKKTN